VPTEVGVDSVAIQLGSPRNMGIASGMETISKPMCEISQLPVSFDAVPDRQGYPCVPKEVGVDSVTIQLGSPENMRIAIRIVTISLYMTEISQPTVSFDAIPDIQGCPCLPMEVGVDSVSIQLGSPENMRITIKIMAISQSVCEISVSQLPVSFDAVPDMQGCPCSSHEVHVLSVSVQQGNPKA